MFSPSKKKSELQEYYRLIQILMILLLNFFNKFVWLQKICKANFSAKMNPSKNAVVQEICQLRELLKTAAPIKNTSIYAFLCFLFLIGGVWKRSFLPWKAGTSVHPVILLTNTPFLHNLHSSHAEDKQKWALPSPPSPHSPHPPAVQLISNYIPEGWS